MPLLSYHAPLRRGSIYVAVLLLGMTAMLIGLSGLTISRLTLRSQSDVERVAQAAQHAESAVALAVRRLVTEPNWRTDYGNDVWIPLGTLDGCTLSFKLVDPIDGNLANDPSQAVHVYGRAVSGDAVRVLRVTVEPRPSARNMLRNPGFEDGLTAWKSDGSCTLSISAGQQSGTACLNVTNRSSGDSGPVQDLGTQLINGQTYYVSAWMHNSSLIGSRRIVLSGQASGGPFSVTLTNGTVLTGSWVHMEGTLTPAWTGDLISAQWSINCTALLSNPNFRVDDVMLVRGNGPPTTLLVIVPGSWVRVTDS